MGIDADMFNSPEWMSEALRIGNTGLWAIEVDEENGKHRMTANETMLLLLGLETHPSPEDCFRHWYGRGTKPIAPRWTSAWERCSAPDSGMKSSTRGSIPYTGVFLCAAAASCCPDAARTACCA